MPGSGRAREGDPARFQSFPEIAGSVKEGHGEGCVTLFRNSRGTHSSSPLVEDAEAITAVDGLPRCLGLHITACRNY